MDRRTFLSALSIGAAHFLVGCGGEQAPTGGEPLAREVGARAPSGPAVTPTTASPFVPSAPTSAGVRGSRPPVTGPAKVVFGTQGSTRQIAITIDDGLDRDAVSGYVEFARRSGIPLNFAPNGAYRAVWNQFAESLRPLVEMGQVQVVNHTWSHLRLTGRSDAAIRDDIERNEDWVESTFGMSTRPWFRPPYGEHNSRTDALAAELGWPRILMWSGSFGDGRDNVSPTELLNAARQYMRPGAIVLGHANQPAVLHLFAEVERLIAERRLEPVTLDTMFFGGAQFH